MISLLLLQISEQYKQITEQYNQLAQQVQVLTSENSELKQLTPNTSLSSKQQQSLVVAQQQSLDIDTPNTSLSAAQIQPHFSGTVLDCIRDCVLSFERKKNISMPNTESKFYFLTFNVFFST